MGMKSVSLLGLSVSAALWPASYWNIQVFGSGAWLQLHSGCVDWGNESVYCGVGRTMFSGWRGPTIPSERLTVDEEYRVVMKLVSPSRLDDWVSLGYTGLDTKWAPHFSKSPRFPKGRLVLPLWIPMLFFAAIFFCPAGFRRIQAHRRAKLGLCIACGYNLRGLPKPRCPECGTGFRPDLTNADPRPTESPP